MSPEVQNYLLLASLFFIHYIADFPLQAEWMAIQKSSSNKALLAHVSIYSGILALWAFGFTDWEPMMCILFALSNGALHAIIDRQTSKRIGIAYNAGNTRGVFMWVGLDQMLHHFCLLALPVYMMT